MSIVRRRVGEVAIEGVASGFASQDCDGVVGCTVRIIVLPLSATQYYGRPDIVYVPVVDAEPDQVYLACEAVRRSKLIADFIRVAKFLHQPATTTRPPEDASLQ